MRAICRVGDGDRNLFMLKMALVCLFAERALFSVILLQLLIFFFSLLVCVCVSVSEPHIVSLPFFTMFFYCNAKHCINVKMFYIVKQAKKKQQQTKKKRRKITINIFESAWVRFPSKQNRSLCHCCSCQGIVKVFSSFLLLLLLSLFFYYATLAFRFQVSFRVHRRC